MSDDYDEWGLVGKTNANTLNGCPPGSLLCVTESYSMSPKRLGVVYNPDRDLRQPLHLVEMILAPYNVTGVLGYATKDSKPIPGTERKAVQFPEPSADIVYHGLPRSPDEPFIREARNGE